MGPAEQRAEGRQAHGVKGAQRDLIAGERAQRVGQVGQRARPLGFDGAGDRVIGQAGVKNAVDHKPLVGQAQRPQLDRGAPSLGERAGIRSRDQHHGRLLRVGQRRHRGLKARLLHLQARVRPEAGCAAIVAGEEPGPGLGQAQQPQRVTGRRGVEHDVVVAGGVGPAFGPAFGIDFEQRGEFVERGDLGGAGAGELLANGCALRERALRLHLGEHALAIGFGGVVGVEVQHREAGGAGHGVEGTDGS